EAARGLSEQLTCAMVVDDDAPVEGPEREQFLLARGRPELSGHLGAFEASMDRDGSKVSLGGFDLVLDLSVQPVISVEKPPLGYFRPGTDPEALAHAMALLPELIGDFQKPRFFAYDENLCAHGARGLTGCTRCMDSCATGAIFSKGETIEVDPFLCQGCGSCAVVCPSGAMSYAFPHAADLLGALRRALKIWGEQTQNPPAVLFHDDDAGIQAVEAVAADLPERILTIAVEDAGSIGPDIWLTLLAMGASDVWVLLPEQVEASLAEASEAQRDLFVPVLEALQLEPARVQVVRDPTSLQSLSLHAGHGLPAAGYSLSGSKRDRMQRAFAHLYRPARAATTTELPKGSPFGQIVVNQQTCTLCMSCAAVCPVEAVTTGGGEPRLLFDESRCLQCGLCETACPEEAIHLEARLHLPAFANPAQRVLNEETPFHCTGCGKPFATEKMIAKITGQLSDHWMFGNARAFERLKMCEDCRIRDLFDEEGSRLGG
ncbi:MAG: 4Fe-4S binding protein, partial [Gammaproteobacteria bacterium]|nr:4Fe-4S binding protein [Gammaproteobacteria bacterium]